MSDDPHAAANAGGEGNAASEIDKTPAPGGDQNGGGGGRLSELGDNSPAAAAAAASEPVPWREDWREALAGKDEKELARLKRFASIENLHKSYREMEKRLSAARAVPTLPENATEEQVAEYRKAIGVPETPEGYGLKFADELKPTETDNELLNGFASHMHGRNQTPAAT